MPLVHPGSLTVQRLTIIGKVESGKFDQSEIEITGSDRRERLVKSEEEKID